MIIPVRPSLHFLTKVVSTVGTGGVALVSETVQMFIGYLELSNMTTIGQVCIFFSFLSKVIFI